MNQGYFALAGVLIGAISTMVSNILLERMKLRRERRGAASAIGASIGATLELAEDRRYADSFRVIMEQAKAGHYLHVGNVAPWRGRFLFDPVVDKYVEKFGILPDDLPGKVTRFYTILNALRSNVERIVDGEFKDDLPRLVVLIETDLRTWEEISEFGRQIVRELQLIS